MSRFKTTAELNVRTGPGKTYTPDEIDPLFKGQVVQEIDTTGWCPIALDDGSIGWVSRKFLVEAPEDVPATPMAQAANYFLSQGWAAHQAAGIVGNLIQESDLNPAAINPRSGALGIAQWMGDRLAQLKSRPDWQSLQAQLAFVDWELKNSEKAAGDDLRQTTTVRDATISVRAKYERAAEAEADDANRLAQAATVYDLISKVVPIAPGTEPAWIKWARAQLGQKEVPGAGDNPVILSWYHLTTLPQELWHDSTAWCAVFVNAGLMLNNVKTIRSALAVDWLGFGTPVKVPQKGDVVVFEWGGGAHHVAYFLQLLSNGRVQVIGGNQSDAVSITDYPENAVMGYRRPPAS